MLCGARQALGLILVVGLLGEASAIASKPVVIVENLRDAIEGAIDKGSPEGAFLLERNGALTGSLKVYYTISGTAENGLDYKTLPGVATIADGEPRVSVTIKAFVDHQSDDPETVVMTLIEGEDYSVSPRKSSATVTLYDAIAEGGDFDASSAPPVTLIDLPEGPLGRHGAPVVLQGEALPSLLGKEPGRIVAFRFKEGWQQIPIQVDERAMVDYRQIYIQSNSLGDVGFENLVYTDPNTFTGPDPDPNFDADDELVFMADDAYARSTTGVDPANVEPHSGIEVRLEDPLNQRHAYAYLFLAGVPMDPSTGVRYVHYDFNLLRGSYLNDYQDNGPNPEDSWILTKRYTLHFSDRWIVDGLSIRPPFGSGTDILDMRKFLFSPGRATRSVKTAADAKGAFIANINGPIRAIRSYIGFNSGPLMQTRNICYATREISHLWIRVHALLSTGFVRFDDFSPAMRGMIYRDNLNVDGVVIDGVNDTMAVGVLDWQLMQGAQGTLAIVHEFFSDLNRPDRTRYYLDDASPEIAQITGDAFAYGASGDWFTDPLPNTDIRLPRGATEVHQFELKWTYSFEDSNVPNDFGQQQQAQLQNPLLISVKGYPSQ